MARSPLPDLFWVRYQPRRVLLSLLGISPAAELAHHRLCALVWSGEPWPPAHPPAICALARIPPGEWDPAWEDLRRLGWSFRKNRLANPAVAGVIQQARRAVASQAARGRLGADATNSRHKRGTAAAPPPHSRSTAPAEPQPVKDKDADKEGENRLSAEEAERLTLSPSARKSGAPGETDFMAELQRILEALHPDIAESELTNWGGWWRNRYREDPDKTRRVLAEVAGMSRERRILKNPGAAALDLWKRLP